MNKVKAGFFSCLAVVGVLMTAACGPGYTRTVMLEEKLLNPAFDGIVVGSIALESSGKVHSATQVKDNSNRNDVTDEELYSAYREYLEESLEKYGIAYSEGDNEYVTNISILGYKEGNAFVRWLTPAGGESKVVVQATLERGGKVIWGIESQQTIAWGGAFSIGGWRSVISWSAQEVAEELCKDMFSGSNTCRSSN